MARNDKRSVNIDRPGGGSSKSEARERAAQLAKEQAQRERRRRTLWQAGIGLVVVVAVLGVTLAVLNDRDQASGPVAAPTGVAADGTYPVGNPDAPVTVRVVEDLQCPACQAFEEAAGDLLDGYSEGDDVRVDYQMIAFLDNASTTDYSSRALNAAACVMDQGDTDVWKDFHDSLYAQQPEERGAGLSDDALIEIGAASGADEAALSSCVEDETFGGWVESTTQQVTGDDFTGTPTVFVNDERIEVTSIADIEAAVDAALAS